MILKINQVQILKYKRILRMMIQLRQEIIDKLNEQYKTFEFLSNLTAKQLIKCTEQVMRVNIDAIDYELNLGLIERYEIKVKYCQIDPFTEQQRCILDDLIDITERLTIADSEGSAVVNQYLQKLKDHIVKYTTKLRITQRYHKYLLYFKYINVKEAIIFQSLSKCQVFYTILRERRKSGKEYFMDPLINCYEQLKQRMKIIHSFHESVLPRKQLRLFEKKNTDKKMKNTLFDAVSNRKYKEVKQLIAKGARIEEPGIGQRMKRQMSCSHRACQLGDIQLCRILDSFKVNWQARQKEGMTPLHFAVQSGSLPVVKFLIEQAKVNFQAKDIQERTSFYFACTEGDMDIIRYLYYKGVDINNKSKLGRSALSKACYLGLVDVVSFLMQCPGIILNSADGKGRTALHNSVFGPKGGREGHKFGTNQKDSPECTQLLLENGFDVDIRDIENNTPMHVSMSSDGIDSIRVLLAFNGSLTKLNQYGQTPLMTGAKFGHLESVIVLRQQYGASVTVKDVFSKNLMLLCAKFRQDDGKQINRVFYYSADQLLVMAKRNEKLVQVGPNAITDWQQQIDFTFSELLKQRARVDVQFKYFCLKCMHYGLNIQNLKIEHIKKLLEIYKNSENQEQNRLVYYILCERPFINTLNLSQVDFKAFIKWLMGQNSTKLLDFFGSNQKQLKRYLFGQLQGLSLYEEIASTAFRIIPQIKEKVLTYCLLKLNINWVYYMDTERYDNILHVLVRHKKVGTLIQILKILSGVKMEFISNKFVLEIINQNSRWKQNEQNGESPLDLLLKNLLLHKNKQGFDPYHLALLIKDASASKLLEQKISKQTAADKSQFEVKQYSIQPQTDPKQLQIFNKGYEIEEELDQFLIILTQAKDRAHLNSFMPILAEEHKDIQNDINIDQFSYHWKNVPHRKLNMIASIQQIQLLHQINKSKVLGIDIQYFYAEGATLISIMQLSTLRQDYIIDFLTSGQTHQSFINFKEAVKKELKPIAYNKNILKIMHGSDNDLCVIKSILNISFLNFIDTARIDVEIRRQQNIRGLATLVNDYLNEHMSKDYQVSQWRIRPIPISMLDYARRDSMVLPFLARKLLRKVDSQRFRQVISNGCKQAKRNRKATQPLIKSMSSH